MITFLGDESESCFPSSLLSPPKLFSSVYAKEKERERQDYVEVSEISKRTKSCYCLTFRSLHSTRCFDTAPGLLFLRYSLLSKALPQCREGGKKLLLLGAHGGVSVKLTVLFAVCYLSVSPVELPYAIGYNHHLASTKRQWWQCTLRHNQMHNSAHIIFHICKEKL